MSTKEPKKGAMTTESISAALFGKARRSVLALLFTHPDRSFYLREVVRWAATGQGAVQRELQRLAAAGIVTKRESGRQVYFQANPECPIFSELCGVVTKTMGVADVLRGALEPLGDAIEVAFVYGSRADGTAEADSDIDLFVIGDVDELKLHRAIRGAEDRLSIPVNYSVMRREEFERRRGEPGGFVERICEGARIGVIGEESDV